MDASKGETSPALRMLLTCFSRAIEIIPELHLMWNILIDNFSVRLIAQFFFTVILIDRFRFRLS